MIILFRASTSWNLRLTTQFSDRTNSFRSHDGMSCAIIWTEPLLSSRRSTNRKFIVAILHKCLPLPHIFNTTNSRIHAFRRTLGMTYEWHQPPAPPPLLANVVQASAREEFFVRVVFHDNRKWNLFLAINNPRSLLFIVCTASHRMF